MLSNVRHLLQSLQQQRSPYWIDQDLSERSMPEIAYLVPNHFHFKNNQKLPIHDQNYW